MEGMQHHSFFFGNKRNMEGIQHNSFFLRNKRIENLFCLLGLSQGSDMDRYNYEFDEDGRLVVYHKQAPKTPKKKKK